MTKIPTSGVFIKVTTHHNTQGDSTYELIDIESKNVYKKFVVFNSTNSQCGYFAVCHAIHFFKYKNIYIPNPNVVKWIKQKKYNSKKYTHKHILKCDNFLNKLDFTPNVFLWDNSTFGKFKI